MAVPATTVRRPPQASSEARKFAKTAARFLLIAAGLYIALYVGAERLVHRYAHRNRFFAVRAAPPSRYDFVVLGASHAAVFDYRDMNQRLEQMTDARIINLSVVGGGVTVNRLLFDYFLTRHQTAALVYVVDSFAFLSRQWNEERLGDRRLFVRAPFDPSLARLLLIAPGGWPVGLDYATGFSKINNPDRFAPDVSSDEGARFDRRYRPVPQLDDERLAYLYPRQLDADTLQRYVRAFEALVALARERGIATLAIKPPLPQRIYRRLAFESEFDAAIAGAVQRQGVEWHDFSGVNNDDALFQDTDHLNQSGVLEFFGKTLAPLLRDHMRPNRPAFGDSR
jgi:hypothetical protein